MHLSTYIYTFLFGKFVGKDKYGNSYYRNFNKFNKQEKRWVIYKGIIEATKIPPLWHRWVHFMTNELPNEKQDEDLPWQKEHRVNFTATSMAYHPNSSKHYTYKKIPSYYKAWKPND